MPSSTGNMNNVIDIVDVESENAHDYEGESNNDNDIKSLYTKIQADPWFQILLISFVCFCCPGMYNALGGMGGSGQVDPTVAANATVALLSTGAVTAVIFAGPIYDMLGPRLSMLIGGWTYALYSGSLLNYNHHQNAAFVIASGALLGIGAAFLWIPQGVIMTTYVPENQKGRAIAVFWIIFNLGGGIGSLASFGINYHSSSGTVTDSTYIAYIIIMLFGWVIGVIFLCSPQKLNKKYHGERISEISLKYDYYRRNDHNYQNLNKMARAKLTLEKCIATAKFSLMTLMDWKLLSLLPMFFYANIFYSYQQNSVNGATFNIRTRALNGALYWFAQIAGGFLMGSLLDIKTLTRKQRAITGWIVLLVVGMAIWGGGYRFQRWNDTRSAEGQIQDIDYKDTAYLGPMFLYIFYGVFDALWQSFCYWMIGTKSNSPAVNGILVGAYKTSVSCGGAMAWRLNALGMSPMRQLAMNWGLTVSTLLCAIPAIYSVTPTSNGSEEEEDEEEVEISEHAVNVYAK